MLSYINIKGREIAIYHYVFCIDIAYFICQ